ncbi:hypothetical protein, partial [Stenotrophomonas maltophilia]|uniref:hypothetical protein n=1 Tax=Stenotrophomonas maltophilia TaxID=40324 RepID=UPI001954FD09
IYCRAEPMLGCFWPRHEEQPSMGSALQVMGPTQAYARFRDDVGGHSQHRSTSKTIRRNMRAIAVIGIALLLNPILDLGENTAWR